MDFAGLSSLLFTCTRTSHVGACTTVTSHSCHSHSLTAAPSPGRRYHNSKQLDPYPHLAKSPGARLSDPSDFCYFLFLPVLQSGFCATTTIRRNFNLSNKTINTQILSVDLSNLQLFCLCLPLFGQPHHSPVTARSSRRKEAKAQPVSLTLNGDPCTPAAAFIAPRIGTLHCVAAFQLAPPANHALAAFGHTSKPFIPPPSASLPFCWLLTAACAIITIPEHFHLPTTLGVLPQYICYQ